MGATLLSPKSGKMKILLSAIACDPHRGSEAHFGWNALRVWSEDNDVWVLGHEKDSISFQQARREGLIGENVRFYPHSQWGKRHPNRILSRIQNWRDYQNWSRQILPTALRLEQEIGFDFAHHATLSTWRVGSELWRLRCPFIWGPIGGAEVFPMRLMGILSPTSALYELLRRAQNAIAFASPSVRMCAQKSSHILASTPETRDMLLQLGCEPSRLSLLSAACFTTDQIRKFSEVFERKRSHSSGSSTLQLFAGGDIEGRKGFALALEALAKCRERGLDFRFIIAGAGPEEGHLIQMAERLGIRQNVDIIPHLAGDSYLKMLRESHIYLMPSFRDNPSLSLLEAMLAGCIPIVANSGGPGFAVDDSCGFRIAIANRTRMIDELSSVIYDLAASVGSAQRAILAQNANGRICKHFGLEAYRKELLAVCTRLNAGSASEESLASINGTRLTTYTDQEFP